MVTSADERGMSLANSRGERLSASPHVVPSYSGDDNVRSGTLAPSIYSNTNYIPNYFYSRPSSFDYEISGSDNRAVPYWYLSRPDFPYSQHRSTPSSLVFGPPSFDSGLVQTFPLL